MILLGTAMLLAPAVALAIGGWITMRGRDARTWMVLAAVAVSGTLGWLTYVALLPHETTCAGAQEGLVCPTIFGTSPPRLAENSPLPTLILLGSFLLPAVLVGWRRLAPGFAVGAALSFGPTALALWTTPRGDNDGLWALVFWMLPMLGLFAAVIVACLSAIAAKRRIMAEQGRGPARMARATLGDRLAALAIDVALVVAVLVVPLTRLSHASQELLAFVLGVAASTLYLAIPLALRGQTVGQRLTGVFVCDAETGQPASWPRSLVRGVIVTMEVLLTPSILFGLPALADFLAAASSSGRSITDRVLRTTVLSLHAGQESSLEESVA